MKKYLLPFLILAACGENGEQGPKGDPGEQGLQGEDGVEGTDGTDGANGVDGTNGADGTNGTSALISTADEPAGDNCENGGTAISYGNDTNGDGTLDADEVDAVEYISNINVQ